MNIVLKVRARSLFYGFEIPGSSLSEFKGFRLSYLKFDFRDLLLYVTLRCYGESVQVLGVQRMRIESFLLGNTIAATDAPSLPSAASISTASFSRASHSSTTTAVSRLPSDIIFGTEPERSARDTAYSTSSASASSSKSATTFVTRHLERRNTQVTMFSQSDAVEHTRSAEMPARRSRTLNDEEFGDAQREDMLTEEDEDRAELRAERVMLIGQIMMEKDIRLDFPI